LHYLRNRRTDLRNRLTDLRNRPNRRTDLERRGRRSLLERLLPKPAIGGLNRPRQSGQNGFTTGRSLSRWSLFQLSKHSLWSLCSTALEVLWTIMSLTVVKSSRHNEQTSSGCPPVLRCHVPSSPEPSVLILTLVGHCGIDIFPLWQTGQKRTVRTTNGRDGLPIW